ncbi:GrpB family protein [Paenibacillus glucanolyticus]
MGEFHHQEAWPDWATEKISIAAPDPAWLNKGLHEVAELKQLLAQYGVVQIEHIGSTSIPGMPAKPIIDVMAKIQSFEEIDCIAEMLEVHRWSYVPPELDGRTYRRFFVRVRNDRRECHLHLMLDKEPRWEKQLQFRNRLREQPKWAQQYAELKVKLAQENQDDREAYTAAKTEFIQRVLGS